MHSHFSYERILDHKIEVNKFYEIYSYALRYIDILTRAQTSFYLSFENSNTHTLYLSRRSSGIHLCDSCAHIS